MIDSFDLCAKTFLLGYIDGLLYMYAQNSCYALDADETNWLEQEYEAPINDPVEALRELRKKFNTEICALRLTA